MSVDLEDLGEMGTLSVQSGSFLQGLYLECLAGLDSLKVQLWQWLLLSL
jgi:hypothetical protein